MQGLINFAQTCAFILGAFIPSALYLLAFSSFLWGVWAMWQQAQPHNPFKGKPWLPFLSLLMSGFFASFPTILTKVMISEGSDVTIGLSSDLTTYDNVSANAGLLGDTTGDTLVNIVTIFQHFFQVFGVATCLFAAVAWMQSQKGQTNRSRSGCAIQFVFGSLLINILTVTQALVTIFST